MSDQTDVILRLRGAVPTKARREELFAGIVAEWARDAGVPLEDVSAEDRAKLRPQFDANLLATVHPSDVIAACRMVQSPSQVVRDLKLGSSRADHHERDGTPKVVWILARDLEHLLAALPALPETQ